LFFSIRRQKAEGRRQKAGGRRQKAEGRRQEAGGRRQEAGGRRNPPLTPPRRGTREFEENFNSKF